MSKFDFLLLVFVILACVDFAQSYYYLNEYGFENEVNPLINDNFSLVLAFVLLVPFIVFCSKLSLKYAKNNKGLISITQFIVLLLIMLKIVVVFNNFVVMLL